MKLRKAEKFDMEVLGLSLFPFSENKNMAGTSVSVPTDISVNCKPLRWAGTCNDNQPPCLKIHWNKTFARKIAQK